MKADLSVGSTRSSIKQVYDVISAFDDKKKEVVTSIGFGGLLFFPPLRQINRRFAVWLMSRVDPLSQMLVIDSAKRIKFNKVDIEHFYFYISIAHRSVSSRCGHDSEKTFVRSIAIRRSSAPRRCLPALPSQVLHVAGTLV
jgi:hypothetical protein